MLTRTVMFGLVMIATLATLALADAASAQYELGRGDALDRNPGVGSGGYNQPARVEDYRARNNIVTGNVPGGMGFRGSVGYSAAGDFRAPVGSDDLFRFRAGSAFSSPQAIQSGRSTDRLRFGYDLSEFEIRRSAAGAMPDTLTERWSPSADFVDTQRRLDRLSQEFTTGNLLERRTEPARLGVVYDRFEDEDGRQRAIPYIAAVTPLRGLEMRRWDRDPGRLGLTTYDMLRLDEDYRAGRGMQDIGAAFDQRFETLGRDDRIAGIGSDEEFARELEGRRTESNLVRPDSDGPQSAYDRIRETLADRFANRFDRDADDEETRRELDRQFSSLRRTLINPSEDDEADSGPDQSPWDSPTERTPDDSRFDDRDDQGLDPTQRMDDESRGDRRYDPQLDPLRDPQRNQRTGRTDQPRVGDERREILEPGRDPQGLTREELTPPHFREGGEDPSDPFRDIEPLPGRDMGMVLRHGTELDSLRTPESEDRFNELMGSAEESLRQGEYFRAERRFNRAMRFSPNHPLAAAGISHAQIGAGIHAAASVTLRDLLTRHPEMIDTRYDAGLLPDRSHLEESVEALRDRFERSPRARQQQSLLLAYLGRHLDDRAIIEEGLSMMPDDDPLRTLLHRVWLESGDEPDDESDATPAPAPAPESDAPEK